MSGANRWREFLADPARQIKAGRRRNGRRFRLLCRVSLLALLLTAQPLSLLAQVSPGISPPQANTPPIGQPAQGVPTPPRLAPVQPAAQSPAPAQQAAPAARPAAAANAASAVRLRSGEHADYTRLVFDFPQRVEYSLSQEGRSASLRFQDPAPIDLGRLAQRPPRWVSGLSAQAENGASVVRFNTPEGSPIKHWRDGGKVVVDVGAPSASPAAAATASATATPAAPAASARPVQPVAQPAAQPAPAPAAPAAAPQAPAAQAAAPTPQVPAARPAIPPAPATAQPAPAPAQMATPAPAPAPRPVASAPNTAPAAPAAPSASMPFAQQAPALPAAAGVPAAAPVLPVQAAAPENLMPPRPTGPLSGDPLVPVVDSARTGPLLIFPFSRVSAAAAFLRNGYLWLVFDRPAQIDLRPITTRDWNGQISDIEQLPVPNMTVLRLAVPAGTTTAFTRRNAGWSIAINTVQPDQMRAETAEGEGGNAAPANPSGRLPPIDVRRLLDSDAGAKLFFAANDPSPPLMVPDPDVGDTITVVPFAGANGGVPERRDFVEATVLPSFQGLALERKAEALDVRRYPRGIELASSNGLSLSAPRGADPRRGGNEIFDYNEWRKAEGADILEQKQNMQRRVGLVPNAQRGNARMALAQFYFANELHAEALGVLAKARQENPELERDKRYRAMRGVSNLKLGRVNDAATDLDSRVFDDDPDVLAYRGLLAAMRDDWPSARKSFSQAGAAVNRFPPDVRGPLRLAMARAWLSGGDVAGAEAEIKALENDQLSRGQAAEASYVRGLLAQAQNKPEEAIRQFDLAAASGDRKARAYAEYAKIEFLLARKQLTNAEAIDRLDGLRFAWRGDPYEFNLLRRLGELQFASGDLRAGIGTFRQLVKYFPKSADIPLLTKQMSDEFARLFLDGGAQSMPPLAALALYYDYRELTPPGPEGDEIIGKLADRLVGVDLLNRAAELLEHQIQYRLRGEDRAKAGARLAVVNLLDRKPEAALKALQGTEAGGLPGSLVQERRLLQVRALADLDRFAEAQNLLGNDNSAEARGLRADIHWRAKDWVAAARVIGQNLGNRFSDPAPLQPEERKQVLQLGVALSLTNDIAGLEDLRKKYQDKFNGTPDAETFNAIASTIARGSGDPRELASAIAQIGQYEAFMSRYRERVARGGITAIN